MQFDQLQRREFFALLGAAAVWPVAARAQKPATQRRIAVFHPAIPTALLTETGGGSAWPTFFRELRHFGYIEGENLIIERYSAEGHQERYADLVREIVTRNPDVMLSVDVAHLAYNEAPSPARKPVWRRTIQHRCPGKNATVRGFLPMERSRTPV